MPSNERRRGAAASDSARFAYDGLDRVIHEKARLGIMTSLAAQPDGLSFTDLKGLCGLTDGNLNRHLEVLREARLVEIQKDARRGRSPGRSRTLCRITSRGHSRFLEYLAELERVVADAAAAAHSAKMTASKIAAAKITAAKIAAKAAHRRLSPA